MIDNLLRDVRHALRGLARTPGFTAAVVITLGLGIGANATVLSTVDALLLRAADSRHPAGDPLPG